MYTKTLEQEGEESQNRAYILIDKLRNRTIPDGSFIVDFLSLVSDKPLVVDKELSEHSSNIRKIFNIIAICGQINLYTPKPRIVFSHVPSTTFFSTADDEDWIVHFEVYKEGKIYHKLTKTFILKNRTIFTFIVGIALFGVKIYDINNQRIIY